MSDTKLYIGNTRADINEDITVEYSLNDIRNFESGSQQSSYDIDLPLTPVNKMLIKYNHELNVKEEITNIAKIKFKDTEVFKGKVQQANSKLSESKIIIKGNYWADAYKNLKLSELALSEFDHVYNTANVQASWIAAAGAFYRYPLVMFSGLSMGSTEWYANDFIPWFNIREVLLKIFEHYTVVSGFIDSTYFKNLYFLSHEVFANENSFLQDKLFDAKGILNDNITSVVVNPTTHQNITLSRTNVIFLNIITNEGIHFEPGFGKKYVIPTTGTYRFQCIFSPYTFTTGLTMHSNSYDFRMQRDGVNIFSYSGTSIPTGNYLIDSGYLHFIAGEEITCYAVIILDVENNTGYPITCVTALDTDTEFKNLVNEACLCIGIGKTLTITDWMPDVTQADFIAAVKHLFNLHFFMDDWNKTLYIEPEQTWHTENEIDLGNAIEQKDIDVELISPNYSKNIYLRFADDINDIYMSGIERINKTKTGEKKITLLSEYAKEGEQVISNPLFSNFLIGNLPTAVTNSPYIATIFQSFNINDVINVFHPNYRGQGYSMKIGFWNGMTAGDTWNYETVPKTTYPDILPLDFSILYPLYYLKTFHYIDRGKLVKLKIRPELNFLQQFVTVIVDTQTEGFRVTYRFRVGVESYIGILNRITFNGTRAILELIIK